MEKVTKKRKRRSNFTQEEIERLVTLVNIRKDVIESKRNDSAIWVEKEAAWKEVERQFNSVGGKEYREAKQLRFKYDAVRRGTRRRVKNVQGCNTSASLTLATGEKKLFDNVPITADLEDDVDAVPLASQPPAIDYAARNDCDSQSDRAESENAPTLITGKPELHEEVDIKPTVLLERYDDKPIVRDPVDKLAEAKLEILNLHKAILEQELAQKREEFVHKKRLYESVGVLNFLKMKILMTELEKPNNGMHM
ncbi:unnamed protein product [Acanthoscelides obtectus]|uniref:Regulatory protein zeste n=1 Tax=Acanthoscelides obtectus TaxID=200917 RepID=A0A9P0P4S7_ACAOB|nr:unnamed protein product [Acanthoscelides obtectus]CAK1680091.1 hypothetical protein AOBTE_LOCUS32504 [Acanthoscelides obtectus]